MQINHESSNNENNIRTYCKRAILLLKKKLQLTAKVKFMHDPNRKPQGH